MMPSATRPGLTIVGKLGAALTTTTALAALSALPAQAQSVIDNGMAEVIDPTGGATLPSPWSPSGLLFIGNGADGTLTIRNGGTLNSGLTFVGAATNGQGGVIVDGPGSTWNGSSSLMLGDSGQGTLIVTNGGKVFNNHGYMGYGKDSAGSALVDGNGSTWTNAMTLYLGREGNGLLQLSNDGRLVAPDVEIAGYAGSDSRIVIGAAEGENAAAAGTLETGIVQFGAGTGTIVFNHTQDSYDFDPALISGTGTGTIRQLAGNTRITALSEQFTGTAEIVGGALEIAGELGGDAHLGGGTLNISGTLGGNVDMTAGWLSVGGTIEGDVEMSTGIAIINGLVGGDYTVNSGNLHLNGSIAGDATLNSGMMIVGGDIGGTVELNGGRLSGAGTLGDLIANTTSTIAPGNSIGTLSARSATINPHSLYEVELNDGGNVAGMNNDWLKTSGAVTLNGGVVQILPENGTDDGTTYLPGTTYTIITADGGVTGEFSTIIDDFAYLNFIDSYDANNVFLTSSLATNSLCLSTMSANQCSAAESVESAGGGVLYAAALSLSAPQVQSAFDQLSGEIHASSKAVMLDGTAVDREAALARMRIDAAHEDSAWITPYGSWRSWKGDGNVAAMSSSSYGALAGVDLTLGDHVRTGLFGGYGRDSLSIDSRASSAVIDHWTVGGVAAARWQGFNLAAGAAYRWYGLDTTRDISFAAVSDQTSADYDARSAQFFGEASYRMELGQAALSPFAGLAYVDLDTDSFGESGGAASLMGGGQSTSATFATLGLRAETAIPLDAGAMRINGMAGYRHAAGGDTDTSLALSSSGDPFTVAGQTLARDTFLIQGGIGFDISASARLSIDYDGEFASNGQRHGVRAALTGAF